MRNQGSRGLRWRRKRNNYSLWLKSWQGGEHTHFPTFLSTPLVVQTPSRHGPGLTIDDMLRRDGLLVGLVAYFIGFRRYEVDELRAAVNHQLPGVVRHSYVGESFFNHLVDGCSGDGEVVVVSRGRSHRGRRMTTNQRNESSGS